MGVQCNKCSGRNTAVVKAKDMADKTSDNSFFTAGTGTLVIDIEALKAVFEFFGKLFGWLEENERNKRNVVVCKDCGYWEKV